VGLINLSVALMFFERSYNRIADLMSSFIELCKRQQQKDGTRGQEGPPKQKSQGQ
jgi:hypothetical protein